MSLLSRFRETVLPSTSRKFSNGKPVDDDVRYYNYRKPTKSFNEKSVKSKNSTMHYTDSHADDNSHHHCDGKEKNVQSSSKLSRKSTSISTVKQSANKKGTNNHNSVDNATLSRSNTFTLDEEEQFQNRTHPKSKKNDTYSDVDGKKYYFRQFGLDNGKASNNVNKDVFETLYSKRASKSSHSSKSSNDSIRGVDNTTPTPNKPTQHLINDRAAHTSETIYKYDSPIKNSHNFDNRKLSSNRSEKSKPRKYLFGSAFNQLNKVEPERENIYTNANPTNSDRFKTITINNLRRSFRESFLDSTKLARGREHQKLWFIDANDDKQQSQQFEPNTSSFKRSTQIIDSTTNPYGNRHRNKVKRNETFRVDINESPLRSKPTTILDRRETYRVYREQSPDRARERLRTPSSDSNSSYSLTTNKVIPVAVTSPYNSLNDIDDNNRSAEFTGKNPLTQQNCKYNQSDKNEDDDNRKYIDDRRLSPEFSSSLDSSPSRHDTLVNYNAKPNEINGYNYKTSDPFVNRSVPGRQSFHDFKNDTIDRPSANRSYASLRSKLEQTGSNLRPNPIMNCCGEVEGSTDNLAKPYEMCSNKPTEAWRRISTRQFSKNDSDTENRSFVPYRNKFDKYDRTKSNNNCNRTTININYNYNMNTPSKKNPSMEMKPNIEYDIQIPMNKSTSAIKSNSGKDKSNKNRSVNFPSVECEIRLISPNYDTKPRRKEKTGSYSWKSKPSNDWTFNKVHL